MVTRKTKQKQIIYDTACMLNHPTATQVYERVHEDNPGISRATVFRVLRNFVIGGEMQSINVAEKDEIFDHTTARHHHFRCMECGRVCDVTLPYAEALDRQVAETDDLEVYGHSTEFYGLCKECKKMKKELSV